jgi:hypothetical protein
LTKKATCDGMAFAGFCEPEIMKPEQKVAQNEQKLSIYFRIESHVCE